MDIEKEVEILEQHFSHNKIFTSEYREALRLAISALRNELHYIRRGNSDEKIQV